MCPQNENYIVPTLFQCLPWAEWIHFQMPTHGWVPDQMMGTIGLWDMLRMYSVSLVHFSCEDPQGVT